MRRMSYVLYSLQRMAFSNLVRHFPSAIDTFVTVVGPLKKQKLCGLAKLQWRSVTPVAWSTHHRRIEAFNLRVPTPDRWDCGALSRTLHDGAGSTGSW